MKKFLLILLLILLFGEMLDDDKNCGSMNMPEGKSSGVDVAALGKGLNAKFCPVTGKVIKPGQGVEAILSNGKKIMMCCPDCKAVIEKDPGKYAALMY
jgi:ribosomal protein L24E